MPQVIESGPFTAQLPITTHADDDNQSLPVVVIMGWAGSKDRSLKHYANLFASTCPTVRSSQPIANIFSPIERPRRQWAESMLSFIQSHFPNRPLVLYAFSNGGAFVIEQIYKLANSNEQYAYLKRSILGCIFDSAPGYLHPWLGKRVLEAERLGGVPLQPSPPTSQPQPTEQSRSDINTRRRQNSIVSTLWTRAVAPIILKSRQNQYWNLMKDMCMGPTLFLYSLDDPLCDAPKLQQLVDEKKRLKQQPVSSMHWESSEHCGHLKRHPQEYVHALQTYCSTQLGVPLVVGGGDGGESNNYGHRNGVVGMSRL